jgi:hypothetical protein
MTRIWYVQLSERGYNSFLLINDKLPGIIKYDLGRAKYSITPTVDDEVILIAKKHTLCKGVIVDVEDNIEDNIQQYLLFIEKITPVYCGMFYRRNWTLVN